MGRPADETASFIRLVCFIESAEHRHSDNCRIHETLNLSAIPGYTGPMLASPLARLALIAALVFSQALYAGHSVSHSDNNGADCKICLQASSSVAISPDAIQPAIPAYQSIANRDYASPTVLFRFPNQHPSRAPPSVAF